MRNYLILIFCLLPLSIVLGADYFWVGGSGDWTDAANHWATSTGGGTFHAAPPGPDDHVFFDANSFTAGGQTVTVDPAVAECRNMDWTGATNNPELLITTSASLDIYGDLVLIAAMDISFAFQFGSRIRMQSDDTGNTITSAGQDLLNFRFEGSGEWTLQDALISSSEIIISAGSLISDGHTIKANKFISTGSGVSLNLSNSLVEASIFNVLTAVTLISTNSDITATTVQIIPPGVMFNKLVLTGSTPSLSGTNLSLDILELAGTTKTTISGSHTIISTLSATEKGSVIELQSGTTLTLQGTIQSLGDACADLITWRSSNPGNAATISKSSGNVIVEYVILQDIHAAGGATFTANNSIDTGNSNGWTINAPAPQTYFWIADDGGNWSDGNNWALATGGAPAGCSPTPADNVVFDANSFNTASGQPVVVVDDVLQQAHDMSWTGVLNTPVLRIPALSQLEIYGDLSLSPAMEVDFVVPSSSVLWLKASDAVTVRSAGLDLVNFRIDGSGSFLLQDALTSSYEIFLLGGTFDLGGFDISGGLIAINDNGFILDMSNSEITASGFRVFNISSLMAANSKLITNELWVLPSGQTLNEVTIEGSGGALSGTNLNLNDLTIKSDGVTTINGNHTISGNFFLNNPGGEVAIQSGSQISLADFSSSGAGCGDEILLRSSNPGSYFTFLFTGGTPPPATDNRFLILQDSRVLNGPFKVDDSVDLGNTPGWVINPKSAQQFFWIGGSGDWDDPTQWSLSSGGGSAGCVPTVNDDVVFDNNSFNAAGQEVVIPGGIHSCRTMEWINSGPNMITNQPTLRLTASARLNIYGSLLLAGPGQMSYAVDAVFSSTLSMTSRTAGNQIRSNGLDLINFRFNGDGGSWTLLDGLTASSELFLTQGSLNTGNHHLSGGSFIMSSTGTSLSLGASKVVMESVRLNSVNVDAGSSFISTSNLNTPSAGLILNDVELTGIDALLSGTNLTLNKLQLRGTDQTTLSGNVQLLADLEFKVPGSTVIFGSGHTVEVGGAILGNGSPGNLISLRASTPGTAALLRKSGGSVCLEYLNIRDNDAGGGATFGAVNATDSGNNSGWIFSADPSCDIFLPVECTDFRATTTGPAQVQLLWTTAQEQNNRGFEIQRSSSGTTFETIAWVEGAGDSQKPLSYQFIDDQLPAIHAGTYYYRLMQVDEDGQQTQACHMISIELEETSATSLQCYPNPAAHSLHIDWQQPTAGPVVFTVFNALGGIQQQWRTERAEGRQSQFIQLSSWSAGYYSVHMQLPDGRVMVRPVLVSR